MATVRRAVELVRGLRSAAGIKVRQPLATALAGPARAATLAERDALLELLADEVNVKDVELIGDESSAGRTAGQAAPAPDRQVGDRIPAIMAAARAGEFEIRADGALTLAGVTLAPDEVEIQATPRPGTAVAHDEGLVVVLDTELSPALLAEGDARELQRAIQDLRREAELDLDDRIEVWLDPLPAELPALTRRRRAPTRWPTRLDRATRAGPGLASSTVELSSGIRSTGLAAHGWGSASPLTEESSPA